MKFIEKATIIEGYRWFKNGDHPEDNCEMFNFGFGEGKVVRYYRTPKDDGRNICPECGSKMHDHGWIDQAMDPSIVCPGDWVIKTGAGFYSIKWKELLELYDIAEK